MHAIFAAGKSANGCRGNMPFGNTGKLIEEDKNGAIYRNNNKRTYMPKVNSGAVARASLYILVTFKNCANPSYFPKENIDWLVKECLSTEVTLWEKHRNQELFRLQGNRNPFIDYP
eukprot:GHVR01089338.1.p1 GENE.GHVR01089338.1~~GHVR01089338.1.p1  ORF type:complete len:116 (-),score=5.85 GHVR01089338.1:5858-6205(-)